MAFTQKPTHNTGKKTLQRSNGHGRSESENSEIDAGADSNDDTHADRMEEKNAGKC
jgi:hypothetical protein